MDLDLKISNLKGVGEKRLEQFKKLKIETFLDLLTHYPKTFLDCTKEKTLKEIASLEKAVLKVKILQKLKVEKIKNKRICKILAKDRNDEMLQIIYFNDVYTFSSFVVGKTYILYGKFVKDFFSNRVLNPLVLKEFGLISKYSLTKGMTKNFLVSRIKQVWSFVKSDENFLPKRLEKKYNLIDFKRAIFYIHFPKNLMQLKEARKRLVFEELLFWQVALLKIKQENRALINNCLTYFNLEEFYVSLPFKLTAAQKRVIEECVLDCSGKTQMNRLIQGDVGSGKTIIAVAMAYLFFKSKMQVALMAPTDILARQHFKTFKNMLEKFGARVGLLVGGLKKKEKQILLEEIENGEKDVVVGTHALFYDGVKFKNLGLIITDEQQRFGVKQREQFSKKGERAHMLLMSATPIPRTLALIIYGDLSVSTIDELPVGRVEVKTFFTVSKNRRKMFKFILKEIEKGHQAYFVCPAIEADQVKLNSVLNYVEILKKNGFLKFGIGVVHGKMDPLEKNEVMEKFLKREIGVLVATTVIEVGVDVKNANVIVIENAEMFGLSQLHQLRGRVGRSSLKSFCFLVSDFLTQDNLKRMKLMCETTNGFEIAKQDLILRGPGDLFGELQHGREVFKIANLKRDLNCIKIARKEAELIIKQDEELKGQENESIRKNVNRFFSNRCRIL